MAIWKTIARIILNGWNKMKKEYWKPILNYEGLYEVSNWGRVRSLDRWCSHRRGKQLKKGRILKLCTNKGGYLYVYLWKNGKGKYFLVHRLVAEAFIPNPDNLPQVNHKDENKLNNNAENLEWCSAKYNSNFGTRNERIIVKNTNGKCSKKVLQYDLEGNFIREWQSTKECGRNGFNQGHVAECCRGERKTHKGFIWKYK